MLLVALGVGWASRFASKFHTGGVTMSTLNPHPPASLRINVLQLAHLPKLATQCELHLQSSRSVGKRLKQDCQELSFWDKWFVLTGRGNAMLMQGAQRGLGRGTGNSRSPVL